MKIVIPVDEKDMGTNVCISFGRTPYFLIYREALVKLKLYFNIELLLKRFVRNSLKLNKILEAQISN
jgi:predicted Fe-Mo cluster-binding NifX family protein